MKINSKMYRLLSYSLIITALLSFNSCEDYLTSANDDAVTKEEVFGDYAHYQGYVDDIIAEVVDPMFHDWNNFINLADESVLNDRSNGQANEIWSDRGDYVTMCSKGVFNTTYTSGYWQSWLQIRKCNIAIAHLNDLVNATEEEKNFIKGQALFLRAWFHFELIKCWGGMPYITKVLSPSDKMRLKRLSYQACADSIASDLIKAEKLLPEDWDQTDAGAATSGDANAALPNKLACWGVLARNYLFAASPLMNYSTDNSRGYTYNKKYCLLAAKACQEVFNRVGDTYGSNGIVDRVLKLEPWTSYKDNFIVVPNNVRKSKVEACQHEKIWGCSQNKITSGWTQIFRARCLFLTRFIYRSWYSAPTANYVDLFESSNGYPIDNPKANYDPTDPWINRDPRLDFNIIFDGEKVADKKPKIGDKYAEFFDGGLDNDDSKTGFGQQKFITSGMSDAAKYCGKKFTYTKAIIRLSEIYLIYAEMVNEYLESPTSVPSEVIGATMTAADAANVIRERAGQSDIPNDFLNHNDFRERIRVERAVELAFETKRWFDLRRWHIASENKYKEKYGLSFDRSNVWKPGDTLDENGVERTYCKPINIKRHLIVTKVFDERNYWCPINVKDVNLYKGFNQNPGW